MWMLFFGFVCMKKPMQLDRFSREESSQRAPPFFRGWWEYKLDLDLDSCRSVLALACALLLELSHLSELCAY